MKITVSGIIALFCLSALLVVSCNSSSPTISKLQSSSFSSTSIPTTLSQPAYGSITSQPLSGDDSKLGYVTVEYDNRGNQMWTASFDGTGFPPYQSNAMTIDKEENVYVTGPITIKFDKSGKQIWTAKDTSGSAIDVDDLGNVVVTGFDATVKYDKNGNKQWISNRYGDSLEIDKSGNVYVAGENSVIKFDANGNIKWTWTPYPEERSSFFAITLDQYGNVYVTGLSTYTIAEDPHSGLNQYVTIKFDADGKMAWRQTYHSPANFSDVSYGIAVDNEGNVYVTGRSFGANSNYDYATIKYDKSGNQLWVARYNGPANMADEARYLCLDTEGDVYVTGESYRNGGNRDYATVKYDTDGNEIWVARYSGPEINDDNYPTGLTLDSFGNVYVTGRNIISINNTGLADDFYATIKYDSNGHQLWVSRYKKSQSGYNEPLGIAVNKDGNIFVTGISGVPPIPPHP